MAQTIVLTSSANQALTVSLQINGGSLTLQLSVNFNEMAGYWVMNIADQYGNPIVNSVPLLTGAYPAANILAPYQYMFIGSAYVINASGTVSVDYPNSSDLGTDFVLLWDNQANYYYAGSPGNPFLPAPGFAGNAGPQGLQGPQGIPGAMGPPGLAGIPDGINPMGTSGTLTPNQALGWTQVAGPLTGTAHIAPLASPEATGTFVIQILQPSTGSGHNVTFDSFYRGISTLAIDTTLNTQTLLIFQVSADATYALLLPASGSTGWNVS